MTPDDEATVTVGDDDTERVYTVENAVADTEHTIELFNADNVDVDSDGVVTFAEAGDEADAGSVDAVITVVNNSTLGSATDFTTVEPVGGEITFTVDVGSANFESVVPVVYFDEDESAGLNVDADGLPAGDEPFGIGGQYNVVPAEALDGAIDGDADIIAVDKAEDWIIATDNDGTFVYYYDSDDFFYEDDDVTDRLTIAEFEAILATGDALLQQSTAGPGDELTVYDGDFSSTFVLDNLVPEEVTGVTAAAQSDSEIDVTWDDMDVDEYVVYRAEANDLDATADPVADTVLAATDDDEFSEVARVDGDAADLEYEDSGLTEETAYVYWVTSVVDDVEGSFNSGSQISATDSVDDAATTSAPGDLAITDAQPNDVINGVGSTDQIVLTFNEDATLAGALGDITVYPTNQPSVTFNGTGASGGGTDTWTVTIDGTLDDSNGATEYTVEIDAGVLEDDDTDPNAALEATFDY